MDAETDEQRRPERIAAELAAQVVACDDAARTRALLQEFAAAKLKLR